MLPRLILQCFNLTSLFRLLVHAFPHLLTLPKSFAYNGRICGIAFHGNTELVTEISREQGEVGEWRNTLGSFGHTCPREEIMTKVLYEVLSDEFVTQDRQYIAFPVGHETGTC